MMVDERKNYFMMGLTVSVYILLKRDLWYIFESAIFIIAVAVLISLTGVLGEADAQSFFWLLSGIAAITLVHLAYFLWIIMVLSLIYILIRKLRKVKGESPYYAIILISFLIHGIVLRYY
jgi:hypothetical protein